MPVECPASWLPLSLCGRRAMRLPSLRSTRPSALLESRPAPQSPPSPGLPTSLWLLSCVSLSAACCFFHNLGPLSNQYFLPGDNHTASVVGRIRADSFSSAPFFLDRRAKLRSPRRTPSFVLPLRANEACLSKPNDRGSRCNPLRGADCRRRGGAIPASAGRRVASGNEEVCSPIGGRYLCR